MQFDISEAVIVSFFSYNARKENAGVKKGTISRARGSTLAKTRTTGTHQNLDEGLQTFKSQWIPLPRQNGRK
ncbi:MAG: hypothetical protein B1H11_10500 [Desulfobacteraceae bacterium 4484_190.1]|nr:MAG: hypothetical protein B1H11_10500 [Desulfobacteraceae bacterium 4484_190.1]